MKKSLFAIFMLLCVMLSSCGSQNPSDASTLEETKLGEGNNIYEESEDITSDSNEIHSNSQDEPLPVYTVNKIGKLEPDSALDDIVPNGYDVDNISWGMSYEIVYRSCNISSINETLFCIQTLEPPYTEWKNHIITAEEWVEGESCIPLKVTYTDYGDLYILLKGTEGYYVGTWSLSKGCSAKPLECDYQILNHEVWCVGDEIGNFFVANDTSSGKMYNYQTLWLDSKFEQKEQVPDNTIGYIWKATETPISGTPYLVGCDASGVEISADSMRIYNSGFSIWEEGQDEPVFTTPYTGMTLDDTVLFYSDTEGYLFNHAGIWNFSIENDTITNINDDEYILWYDASLRRDDSVLMLSTYYNEETGHNEYYLWEMLLENLYNE